MPTQVVLQYSAILSKSYESENSPALCILFIIINGGTDFNHLNKQNYY